MNFDYRRRAQGMAPVYAAGRRLVQKRGEKSDLGDSEQQVVGPDGLLDEVRKIVADKGDPGTLGKFTI